MARKWKGALCRERSFRDRAIKKHNLPPLRLRMADPFFWRQNQLLEPTWRPTATLSKAQKRSRRERMRKQRKALGSLFSRALQEADAHPRGRCPATTHRALWKSLRSLRK